MDELYKRILMDLREGGMDADAVLDNLSVGSSFGREQRRTRELIGYKFILENPRSRLLYNDARNFDLFFAFGQFVWNIASSNDLKAISFYNGKGIDFSDDGSTIYGSCYGKRLFATPSGIDQVKSIIDRLRQDPSSRRTFAAIFQPADNVTMTRDVPCPIGVQYLVRNSRLHAITFMRSNSAAFVLPYNVFFFTMVQELIARELGIDVGDYIHICSSLHYYYNEEPLIENALSTTVHFKEPMKHMPKSTSFEYLGRLVAFNDELLREVRLSADRGLDVDYWLGRAREFDSYWSQVAYILISHALKKTGKMQGDTLEHLIQKLNPEYRFFVGKELGMIKH